MTTPLAGYLHALLLSCSIWLVCAGPVAAGNTSVAVDQRVRGNLDAPVTMVEYSDFTCGFCLKFFKETWPRLQARYVNTGKVRFLYKDYPRADQGPGLAAAVAARCAGDQGAYWPMHDRLFAERARLDQDLFLQHAKTLGLDQAGFSKCLRDGRHVQAIFQDRQEANSWGFRGTPGFVIMRSSQQPTAQEPAVAIPGAFPFESFAEEIDRLLETPHAGAPRSKR
jgi:protein-disulfide isomerase